MFNNNKLPRYKAGKIAECFCIDIGAAKKDLLLKLNRKTVSRKEYDGLVGVVYDKHCRINKSKHFAEK